MAWFSFPVPMRFLSPFPWVNIHILLGKVVESVLGYCIKEIAWNSILRFYLTGLLYCRNFNIYFIYQVFSRKSYPKSFDWKIFRGNYHVYVKFLILVIF